MVKGVSSTTSEGIALFVFSAGGTGNAGFAADCAHAIEASKGRLNRTVKRDRRGIGGKQEKAIFAGGGLNRMCNES